MLMYCDLVNQRAIDLVNEGCGVTNLFIIIINYIGPDCFYGLSLEKKEMMTRFSFRKTSIFV